MHNTPSKYYDDKIPIEQVLYGQFIKYTSLERMVAKEFVGSNANTVNVYIDILQLVLPAFRCLRIQYYYTITSVVLNYCAHIRAYFRSRHGVETNIILVYSPNMSSNNTKYIAEYNSKYSSRMNYNTKMMENLQDNIEMIRLLVKFFDNIFLKEGTVEPGVIIAHLANTIFKFPGVPNIVISTSDYMFQLPSVTLDTVVFHKKNNKDMYNHLVDASYSYNALTASPYFIYETKGSNKGDVSISPFGMVPLMCLTGLPGRSLNSIFNATTALKIVRTIPNEALQAGDIEYIFGAIKMAVDSLNTKTIINLDEFANRFKALDIRYQLKMYEMMPQSKEQEFLQRLHDPDTVKEINNKYFEHIPIDLQRL